MDKTSSNQFEMKPASRRTVCQRMSSFVVGGVERFFYRYGKALGAQPWHFIFGSLALVAFSSLGMLRFRQEKHPMKLWVPEGSDFATDTEWLMSSIGEGYRVQSVLITADDVLQPHVVAQMQEIHRSIVGLVTDDGVTWDDVCFRVPVVTFNFKRRRREIGFNNTNFNTDNELSEEYDEDDEDEGFDDPSIYFSQNIYCSIVDSLETTCYSTSILDFWRYDINTTSDGLTKPDILSALNTTLISPTLGHPTNYIRLLGGIERDETGRVVAARAVLSLYMVAVNFSTVNMDETGNDAGTADWANGPALLWEKKYLQLMKEFAANAQDITINYEAGRSFGDISETTMFQDIDKLIVGVLMMYVYVQVILSKCNMVEIRFHLATVGLGCIGMAFIVACGICSLIGIPYGPVHTALPFLLMGIGVDDMFVIMACWNNLTPAERQKSLPEKMGRTLQHAGTSITITSLTNGIAFAVGATTILPSLQSFCLYAAMGIFITFIFQASLFTACFVLDERRVMANRNGILFCYQHTDFKPNTCSQIPLSSRAFKFIYSKIIFTNVGKVLVLLLTIGVTSISIKGNMELKQKFDPAWFLPKGSHLHEYLVEKLKFYPDSGIDAGIYMGRLNYSAELGVIDQLVHDIYKETKILKDVDEWYTGFKTYANKHFKQNLPLEPMTEANFSTYISRYLFSPQGAKFQRNFQFDEKLKCGQPAPPIVVSSIDFNFHQFPGPEEYLPAMNRMKQLAREANFTTGDKFATAWGKVFANWVTDEVIDTELYRNLLLACICVMICTVFLIVNVVTCFFIFICVVLTLLNVAGMMYFWGLTIDITTCIGLQLAAGLCVDYAAHIGHKFLLCSGTRYERALQTVTDIGPAVVSGGVSTLLALSVLAGSKSYVFVSFFKIFGLVVVFGLFHGTVLLPVLLSMFGSEPYQIPDLSGESNAKMNYELCSTRIIHASDKQSPDKQAETILLNGKTDLSHEDDT